MGRAQGKTTPNDRFSALFGTHRGRYKDAELHVLRFFYCNCDTSPYWYVSEGPIEIETGLDYYRIAHDDSISLSDGYCPDCRESLEEVLMETKFSDTSLELDEKRYRPSLVFALAD